jgi:Flp pilus assembly protein TadD
VRAARRFQRNPREPRYTYNLGLTLQREGRVDDAALSFRKTLELNPRFAAAASDCGKSDVRT